MKMRIDWLLCTLTFGMLLLGLIMMSSASTSVSAKMYGSESALLLRQLAAIAMGLAAAYLVWITPLATQQRFARIAVFLVPVALSLVWVPGLGAEVNGANRWVRFAGQQFQVSELAKFVVVLYMADFLARRQSSLARDFQTLIPPLLLVGLICCLIVLEPDFGTTAVLAATVLGMCFLAGAHMRPFIVMLVLVLVAAAWLLQSESYRVERLLSFLDPWDDPFDTDFQLSQSLIAIGSGSLWGVGLGNSVQKLFYLPEAHTDFVFAVFAEEFGFLGVVGFVVLVSAFIGQIWRTAYRAEQAELVFASLASYGIAMWFALQAFINVGVAQGVLPTKGITLPLVSYGGSSMLVAIVCMGFLMRVAHETSLVLDPVRPGRSR